ncbi:MAG: epoxyqueuosine reductase QueH [Patescibacteria group bacterium]|nr:epoxyqueuosine reductase QueH [Patescibacteria group bacterium]
MLLNLGFFIAAALLSLVLSLLVRRGALFLKITDCPDGVRKLHRQETALLGGVAIFLTFFIILFFARSQILSGNLEIGHWLGFFGGALILMIGGFLDDKYNLAPRWQIIFPVLAALAPIIGGVGIAKMSNPLGGFIMIPAVLSAVFILLWLLGMMYTTKLLDGVDGLVSGLGLIGSLVIFLFTSTTQYSQPDIAVAALIFSGACLGFLVLNFNPAKIFLGEGGSLFIGYVLGVLAIISGGKIAIALLIMGLPILDVFWTIARRLLKGKNPFRFADRQHLHHRLLDLGLSPRQTVAVFYVFAAVFGLSGLFLQSRGKLLALIILLGLMLLLIVFFSWWERTRRPRLLFHICCAPCASYSTQTKLIPHYRVTWYFYNPNLSSAQEYERRLQAARRAAAILKIDLIAVPYRHEAWREMVRDRERDAERGARCQLCYRERLQAAYDFAKRRGFRYFSTSLLVSPYKDGKAIRKICRELSAGEGPLFLDQDFQADNGFRASLEWAREKGLYLQRYCGCEFSFRK